MKYYEVIREHGYLNEVLGLTIECENIDEALTILKNNGYIVNCYDDDFERIYVK